MMLKTIRYIVSEIGNLETIYNKSPKKKNFHGRDWALTQNAHIFKTNSSIFRLKNTQKGCAAQRYMLPLCSHKIKVHITVSKNYIHRSVCIKQSFLLIQYDEDPSRIS